MINPQTRNLSYSEMIQYDSLEDRIKYLELHDFNYGSPRDINQRLYSNKAWLQMRKQIIIRDNGYDLGLTGVPLNGRALIHHINPITRIDIEEWNEDKILNPENLVLVSYETHGRIHYSNSNHRSGLTERSPGDTKLW